MRLLQGVYRLRTETGARAMYELVCLSGRAYSPGHTAEGSHRDYVGGSERATY